MTPSEDRIRRSMQLGAVGDALGAPVEFMNRSAIVDQFGDTPPERLDYATGARPTDDTQMMLFVAEGLARALEQGRAGDRQAFRNEMAESLVHWLATQDAGVGDRLEGASSELLDADLLHERRAPGNTCTSSCRHIADGAQLPGPDNRINNSKGCGTVMRTAPLGLAADSPERAFEWAVESGALTHTHPTGWLAAGYFAVLLQVLSRGGDWREAFDRADALLDEQPDADETRRAVDAAREAAGSELLSADALAGLGEGWIAEEALSIGLAVALSADTTSWRGVRSALWRAVAHSGDSDSTGMVAGNLVGAAADRDLVPADWQHSLELGDLVDRSADRLAASAGPGG